MVRNLSDIRSILWVVLAITFVVIQYYDYRYIPYLFPLSCYLATSIGTIAHNHSHRPIFHNRFLNQAFGHVITLFYGYPTLMWIPTHNLNHHKFVNRPGDATATWRYTNKHNLFVALTYPLVSAYFQQFPIKDYIERVKDKKPGLYGQIRFQYRFWIGSYIALLALAAYLYHSQQTGRGLYVWAFAVLLPGLCSSTVIMFFNFIQHVHTDAWSDHDHSRNFVGRWFNFLFFNNGYHTAHHDNPGLHWSELPEVHAKIAGDIDPSLNQKNLVVFMIRQYFLSPLFPSMGTSQIGDIPSLAAESNAVGSAEVSSPSVAPITGK